MSSPKNGQPMQFASMPSMLKLGPGGFYVRCGFAERGRVTYKGNPLIYYERLLPSWPDRSSAA
jgi:hypothetical protein